MQLGAVARYLPQRLATGAYILHSGLEKWRGSPQQAEGVHGTAAGAYPFLADIPPTTFLRALSVGEITVGALLLLPFGALLGMYLRTPDLHRPASIWPSPKGIAVSKDVWMLGIGAGLVLDSAN